MAEEAGRSRGRGREPVGDARLGEVTDPGRRVAERDEGDDRGHKGDALASVRKPTQQAERKHTEREKTEQEKTEQERTKQERTERGAADRGGGRGRGAG